MNEPPVQVPFRIPATNLTGSLFIFDGRHTKQIPYSQLIEDIQNARARLEKAGLKPNCCVGIMGENCYEWIVYDLAVMSMGCLLVCFPTDEFSEKNVEDLANNYDLSLLLLTKKMAKNYNLPWIVTINDGSSTVPCIRPVAVDKEDGLLHRVRKTDVCSIIFSSGTSGQLKCLLLSRKGIEVPIDAFANDWKLNQKDGVLVALPLSVFQQRLMVYACLRQDSNILFTDSANLFRSFKILEPSVILGPPALFESIERKFIALPALKRNLMQIASSLFNLIPLKALRQRSRQLLFKKFAKSLGGKVRILLTGSAPSKLSTLRFFKAMGLSLFQAYGLAEVGFIAWNLPARNRFLSVGQPIIPNSVKIADDGEIIVSIETPQAAGYFGMNSEEQERTFLPNGDVATGDVGRFDKNGYLYITGRKKNIILLQSGEKIHPETLEQSLGMPYGVDRIVVIGGGDWSGLAAVVAINPECNSNEESSLRKEIQSSIDVLNLRIKPSSHIVRLFITRIAFVPSTGFVTRNLKVDREAVRRYFEKEFTLTGNQANGRESQ